MYQYAQVTGFPISLIDVEATPITRIMLKFKYTSSEMNYQIGLQPGITYKIIYLDQGELKEIHGLIVGAYRHFSPSTQVGGVTTQTAEWIVRVDASEKNNALVVDIPTTQIRLCKIYTPHSEEDNSKISDADVYGGNTYGTIKRATISDYKKDDDGGITGGEITDGDIDDTTDPGGNNTSGTTGGITHGTNESGTPVIGEGGFTTGGNIIKGAVISGHVTGGEETEINGIPTLKNCILTSAVISGSLVKRGTTYNASILDTVFTQCVIINPTRTGSDVVIQGATVNPSGIAHGGWATGGTVTGPIAYGTQNGKLYIIHGTVINQTSGSEDEEDTYTTTVIGGVIGKGGVTSGGTGYGGVVSGGKSVGNVIIGGTVTGGSYNGGIDYGSTITVDTTIGGWIESGTPDNIPPEAKEVIMGGIRIIKGETTGGNGSSGSGTSYPDGDWHSKIPLHDAAFDWDGLIIWNDSSKGIGSNIKTVNL